jgi:uncharacterized protein YndB with AHSA1/START domain
MKYLFLLVMSLAVLRNAEAQDEAPAMTFGHFTFERTLTLPGSPEEIYDAITGDISGWWDHTFFKNPARFVVDNFPGGGFWEIFDESGDGVKHAEVIYAHRGKMLRLDGPFGLSGRAVQKVVTYYLSPGETPETTQLRLVVHCTGAYEAAVPEMVERVWNRFLFDRLKPYVEAGKHLKKQGE